MLSALVALCLRASPLDRPMARPTVATGATARPRSQIKNRCPTAPGIHYNETMNADIIILRSAVAVTARAMPLAAVLRQATAPALHPVGFHLITL